MRGGRGRGVCRGWERSLEFVFGGRVETEGAFADLRGRWREMVRREEKDVRKAVEGPGLAEMGGDEFVRVGAGEVMGVLTDRLKYGSEAVRLREECALRVREYLVELRRKRGWPDEDPKARMVDTWREEGRKTYRAGKMDDGSWVGDL